MQQHSTRVWVAEAAWESPWSPTPVPKVFLTQPTAPSNDFAVRVGVPRIIQARLSKLPQDSVGVRSPRVSSLILSFARESSVTTRLTRVGGACKSEPEGGRGQACQSLCHLLGTGVFGGGCRGRVPPPRLPPPRHIPPLGWAWPAPGLAGSPRGRSLGRGSASQSRPTGQSGSPRGRPRRRHIRRLSRGA